jgi:tripartite-type tricarboxylate transporter receptor subunit TctC
MKALVALPLLAACVSAAAQNYPTRPIRVISNAASASPGDIALRLMAPRMAAGLGQPLIPETKGGGGGAIAAQDAIRAGADGHALLYSSSQIITSKYLLKNVTVDVMKDLAPVSVAARVTNLLAVHGSVPVGNVKDMVDYSKRNPGKLTFSSNGIGSSLHLQWVGFLVSTGADMFHVPYGSANESIRNSDFLTGRISAILIPWSSVRPSVEAGKVKVLAVIGDQRYKRLPDVPAIGEIYPDYKFSLGFWGFFAAAGVPAAIVSRVSDEVQKAARDPDIIAKLEGIDVETVGNTPQAFASYLRQFDANVATIIRAAKIEAQ